MKMKSPKTVKEIQTLNGRIVAIHRFLARAADKTLPFMVVLKECLKSNAFQWTEDAEKAFQELKIFLTTLPTLTAPIKGEELYVYLSASEGAVNDVLLVEREEKQVPIYYISKVLKEYEM
jgi:hypothetical protein